MSKTTSAIATGKTAAVSALAEKHGWTADTKEDVKNDITTLKLTRGDEWVEIRWDRNSCKEMPTVCHEGQLRYVRNVAAAKRVLEATAEQNAEPFQKRAVAKQAARKTAPAKRPRRKDKLVEALPDSDDQQIKEALLGRKILWRNSTSGEFEEDVVLAGKNTNGHYYVSHEGEKRQINFIGAYGFRAVKISAIAQVR
ncbi:hypothetical protein SEA_CHILL_52 [Mycobacterium phage Chill]|uniref:Uncharacterized protein n=2 Tax=Plotvirus plot TaxID=2170099 RepID=A0A481VTC0_9CAUD|nr:hypothetical protein SEA_CHILL_52 [Mycobacterium phage Chill]QBP30049.1 hypothetical protein SEA_WALDOWHY_52 [Mycobacterium phage WaldoWhy]